MTQTRKARTYDSKNRENLAEKNKAKVIDLAIKLLKKEGGEFSIRKLSKSASCSERHLYRMFGGLEGLAKELNRKINEIIGFSMNIEEIKPEELPELAKRLFRSFNQNEQLIKSYLVSPVGELSRKIWLDEKNLKLRNALTQSGIPPQLAKEVSVLMSAAFWKITRFEAGMTDEESVRYVGKLAERILKESQNG